MRRRPPLPCRSVSKRLRDLVDVVLEERFLAKWGLAGVAAPPPAAPAYAAARPAAFVLCVALRGRESLAALAVRHGTDVTALKRLNNLLSDNALQSRWAYQCRELCVGSWRPVALRRCECPVLPNALPSGAPFPQDTSVRAHSRRRGVCGGQARRLCARRAQQAVRGRGAEGCKCRFQCLGRFAALAQVRTAC